MSLVHRRHSVLKLPYEYDPDDAVRGFEGCHSFLSNFYRTRIRHAGKFFGSSEHVYMWCKSEDPAYRSTIINAKSPGLAKRLGKGAKLVPNWNSRVRYSAMLLALQLKFKDEYLKNRLLNTEHAYLEETNHWGDVHWGCCDGKGENHLGQLLMVVRYSLQFNSK